MCVAHRYLSEGLTNKYQRSKNGQTKGYVYILPYNVHLKSYFQMLPEEIRISLKNRLHELVERKHLYILFILFLVTKISLKHALYRLQSLKYVSIFGNDGNLVRLVYGV